MVHQYLLTLVFDSVMSKRMYEILYFTVTSLAASSNVKQICIVIKLHTCMLH